MNTQQALEYSMQPFIPMFIFGGGYEMVESERLRSEEALKALVDEWNTNPEPSFGYDVIVDLADRNRELCDHVGETRLRNKPSSMLARSLPDADTFAAIGKMQRRSASAVMREIHGDRETTGRAPERGYIINVGWEIMELTSDATPHDAEAHYCGLPEIYRESGVPLTEIHHITWEDIDNKTPFRENKALQKQILKLMKKYPYMAHNAAFEDSWFKLHLEGYAEARREGKIVIIDSREICRRLDSEVKTLPRESSPAALENWARRRGTLGTGEVEQHLGLDDTDLMLRTVQAEFNEKNLFAK